MRKNGLAVAERPQASKPAAGASSRVTSAKEKSWPDRIYDVLRENEVRQVAYVPDSGHARLIELARADKRMRAIPCTTEEEGVALAVGACLGGERAVLLTQSSGVGNCINMLSMIAECRVPLLMLVTMRGEWGEFNPWQLPMSQGTKPVLTAMGVVVQRVDKVSDMHEIIAAALKLAFNTSRAVAVLISQRIIGAKAFGK